MRAKPGLMTVVVAALGFAAMLVAPTAAQCPAEPCSEQQAFFSNSRPTYFPGYGWACANTGLGCSEIYCVCSGQGAPDECC